MKRIISVALALVMIFALTATVAAEYNPSPSGDKYYSIKVKYVPSTGIYGTASGDKSSVLVGAPDPEGNVTITAVTKDNGIFQKWTIEGDYDLVSGSLNDLVMVIKPKSDIVATAYFTGPGSTPDETTPSGNDDKNSPKTGDPLWIILGLSVLALGAGALAVKKIKE